MTIGELIAFRIISGYVTQPLLRLASIWQNFQELSLSFESGFLMLLISLLRTAILLIL